MQRTAATNGVIKAIVFDLGRVVVDFDHMISARRISAHCVFSAEQIYQLFFDSPATGLFEEGRISPQEFFAGVRETLRLSIGYDEFVPIWNEIFFLSEQNKVVYSLAKSLQERYTVAMLTNVNVLHLEYLKKNFAVFDPFHHIIASCEVHERKPNTLIYQKALDALGAPAQCVFYTDDRPELIESARALGINSFVFKDAQQLRADLLSNGVDVA